MASTERLKSYLDQYPFVAVAYVEKQEGHVFDSLLEAGTQFTMHLTMQFTRFTRTNVQVLTPEELLQRQTWDTFSLSTLPTLLLRRICRQASCAVGQWFSYSCDMLL